MEPRVTVAEGKVEVIPFWRRKAAIAGAIAVLVVIIGVAVWSFYLCPPPIEPASVENMHMKMDEIRDLWQQHLAAPFPEDVVGIEIGGQDLLLLDSFTAGCVDTFIDCGGTLDTERHQCLLRCRRGLATVVPILNGESKAYYVRLLRLSDLVLEWLSDRKCRTTPSS